MTNTAPDVELTYGRSTGEPDAKFPLQAMEFLRVLAQFPEGCNRSKLSLVAGYRWSGSSKNCLAMLRRAGAVQGGNTETMRITDAGLAYGPFKALPEGRDLIEFWCDNTLFSKQGQAYLRAIVDAGAVGLTSDELGQATGYRWSGSSKNELAALRTAGVIEGKNTGKMKLVPSLLKLLGEYPLTPRKTDF